MGVIGILDNLVHRCDIYGQQRTRDALGGHRRVYIRERQNVRCWFQTASAREIDLFEKKGQRVDVRVYFTPDPQIDESKMLRFVDESGKAHSFEVVADSNAGVNYSIGLWKVMARELSSDIDPQEVT